MRPEAHGGPVTARRYDPERGRFYEAAGRCIRQARGAAGWTQAALSRVVGIAQSQLALIEQGTAECPFYVAARIADALDMTCDDFAPVTLEKKEAI
jgi:transcriptional regulator with XRE-family HTH domain